MINKDSIESAYSFFHQKYRVYAGSTSESQRDDIEYAIADYVNRMSPQLYERLANGRSSFLFEHKTFAQDMETAIFQMEKMMGWQ